MLTVISKTDVVAIDNLISTNHNANERMERTNKIINIIGGYGKPMYSFIVDTNHPNGYEIHTITDNGIIVIQNERTKRLVTCLIARGNQIRRYFDRVIPIEAMRIVNIAERHREMGYNNW